MSHAFENFSVDSVSLGGSHVLAKLGTVLLAAATSFTLVMGTAFFEDLTSSRMLLVLLVLLALHILSCPRLLFCREFALYGAFVVYLFVSLLWTPDGVLGMNTLFPAVDFLLILVLIGSLVAFHDLRAALIGLLVGFWIGAGIFTQVSGFPFVYPKDFSYNSVASMYLYALYATLALSWTTHRYKALLLVMVLVCLLHIAATTSIKTSLGIVLGTLGACVIYFRESLRIARRNAIPLVLGLCAIGYGVASSKSTLETLQAGLQRVALGFTVLRAREDQAGYSGFGEREYWMHEGLQAWARNPLFGNGVEAFRANFGITSHSTPVDLLYNTGLIGFSLFYAMFAALAWRLLDRRAAHTRGLRALVLAGVLCNLFVALSGTLFYQTFLAGFIAISAALLLRSMRQAPGPAEPAVYSNS